MDTKDGTAEDNEEKSSENGKTGTNIREAMEKLLEFEEKIDNGRKDILNTILEGLSGLEATYDERLTGLEEDIKELKSKEGKEKGVDFIFSEEEYLFSTDIDAELEDDLNNGIVSGKLKNLFKTEKGITPSENAYPQKEEDNKWKITDKEKVYIIKKEDERLNIYKVELNISEVVNALRQILKEPEKLNISEVANALGSIDRLEAVKETYLFSWDSVPGNDNEKLVKFLRDDFDIDWAENAEFYKTDDGMSINISEDEKSVKITMDENKETAILIISDDRTHDLKVKRDNSKLNIYDFYISEVWQEKIGVIEPFLDRISEDKLEKLKFIIEIATLLSEEDTEIIKKPPLLNKNFPLDEFLGVVVAAAAESKESAAESKELATESKESATESKELATESKESFKKLTKIPLLYHEGVALLKEGGKWTEACKRFDEIVKINPNLKGAWLNKGVALGELNKIDDEIDCYKKALAIDRNYKKASRNMRIAEKEKRRER
jgi:tetratricopeptide (TPR) repeat protein